MTPAQHSAPVMQLRVALTTSDYARLVEFYCTGLGLEPAQVWTNNDARGLMLEMGQATLEIFDDGYADYIDQLEAGTRVSGPIRFALQVPDLHAAMERLLANGATLVHPPVVTPWGRLRPTAKTLDHLGLASAAPVSHRTARCRATMFPVRIRLFSGLTGCRSMILLRERAPSRSLASSGST